MKSENLKATTVGSLIPSDLNPYSSSHGVWLGSIRCGGSSYDINKWPVYFFSDLGKLIYLNFMQGNRKPFLGRLVMCRTDRTKLPGEDFVMSELK